MSYISEASNESLSLILHNRKLQPSKSNTDQIHVFIVLLQIAVIYNCFSTLFCLVRK